MANGCTVITKLPYKDSTSYGPYAINNWHFSYNPAVMLEGAEGCALFGRSAIIAFWKNTVLTSKKMSYWLPDTLTGQMEFSFVDWEDPAQLTHPLDPTTLTTAGATTNLLNEAAVCMTFKCDPYDSLKRQSFYNRVYLGPLIRNACTGDSDSPGRPSIDLRNEAVEAYNELQTALDTIGFDNARHVVYSPKNDSSGVITSGWLDNAFDIQRRRGVNPTVKTMLEIA